MAYDQLKIYNNALVNYLGEGKLNTLAEERGPRYLLDQVWEEDPVLYCLEQGSWQFATRTVRLEADPGIEPDFGMRYVFAKPDDYVRTAAMSASEYFNEAFTGFTDEAGFFVSDLNILYLKYVSDDEDYGRDYAKWTPAFYEYISCYHAWKIVNRITGAKSTRAELSAELEKMKSDAQAKDGVNRPVSYQSPGSWSRSRHGRYAGFRGERR